MLNPQEESKSGENKERANTIAQKPGAPQQQQQPQGPNKNETEPERRDRILNRVKSDADLKDAWIYLFKGKILKFWTDHGTTWQMHLLLSDDGYSLVLRGKKKWEADVRLDSIDGIWKGYFSNSPFANPKKLFTRSKYTYL